MIFGIVIWLVVEPTPLKNDGVNVSWDDDYSQYMDNSIKIHLNPVNHYNPLIPTEWKVIKAMIQTTNQ